MTKDGKIMLGKWVVGEVSFDGFTSRNDPCKYKAVCFLPGIKTNLGYFKTQDEAQKKIESIVEYWLEKSKSN